MRKTILLFSLFIFLACNSKKKQEPIAENVSLNETVKYATGFTIDTSNPDMTVIKVNSPWPNAEATFSYALIPKEKMAFMTLNKDEYDAIVAVPIKKLIVTSTTHIPALEALDVLERLVGFPDTKYISSSEARKRIDAGKITEIGNNESLNTEMVLELNPEVIFGFAINGQNNAYETLQRSNIQVVYNGDWTEQTPLGKAEWIKFFAPFFKKEKEAQQIFSRIEKDYLNAKILAKKAKKTPTVLSGAMYKDVWYLPGGKSWAAQFIIDANAEYLWQDTKETGSLSLSWEKVLEKAQRTDFWVAPGQHIGYEQMKEASAHYEQFDAFKSKKIFTFSNTLGTTGGLLYYELAPQRPDLVLKDLIHIFHPDLLPEHKLFFFKPLK